MLKGAIFDVDGTLLDSMIIWEDLGKNYLLKHGIEPRADLRDALRPLSCGQSAQYLKNEYPLPFSVEEITGHITEIIADFYKYAAKLKPGVRELIEHLSSMGVKLCIATASDEELIKAALERENVIHFFEKVFTCEAVGKSKAFPDVYLAALAHMGCHMDECIVFEDSYHAITTAKRAGFTVAGVFDPFEPRGDKAKSLCDYWFETIAPPYGFDKAK